MRPASKTEGWASGFKEFSNFINNIFGWNLPVSSVLLKRLVKIAHRSWEGGLEDLAQEIRRQAPIQDTLFPAEPGVYLKAITAAKLSSTGSLGLSGFVLTCEDGERRKFSGKSSISWMRPED